MSFRDEVNNTTRSVMIETFITSIFKDEHRRFGDILEDLIELDDPDDDWMRDTLYDLEVGQFVRAGMKVLGLAQGEQDIEWVVGDRDEDEDSDDEESEVEEDSDEDSEEEDNEEDEEEDEEDSEGDEEDEEDDDGVVVTETEDGTEYSLPENSEEEEAAKPKKKRKKKKPENGPKKRKKKTKSVPARRQRRDSDGEDQEGYLKLILKALRAAKAYDEETAVNNRFVLDHIHGEGDHGDEEGAAFRAGIKELEKRDKVTKTGQRRGTRYHLN